MVLSTKLQVKILELQQENQYGVKTILHKSILGSICKDKDVNSQAIFEEAPYDATEEIKMKEELIRYCHHS